MNITKAIIPVAGLGTRFLPASKSIPKEMITLIDRPLIDYIVDEALNSGLKEIIFITGRNKSAIEEYFDRNVELETHLKEKDKKELLEKIQHISRKAKITSIRQKDPLGLGHAVWCGKSTINKGEMFAVLLGDDLIFPTTAGEATAQLVQQAEKLRAPIIGVMNVPRSDTNKYGIIAGKETAPRTHKMTEMVEKPKPENAPTTLATPGRYVLPYEIFEIIESTPKGAGGEIQLTDAINTLAKKTDVYAYEYIGDRYDCGYREGLLEATLYLAKKDSKLREVLK